MFGSDPSLPAALLVLVALFAPLIYFAVLSPRDQPMKRIEALLQALAAVAEATVRGRVGVDGGAVCARGDEPHLDARGFRADRSREVAAVAQGGDGRRVGAAAGGGDWCGGGASERSLVDRADGRAYVRTDVMARPAFSDNVFGCGYSTLRP